MSKCKRIILTIIIALLGIGLEVVNYYVFALNDRFFEIGVATAGLYIASISVIGNIMFNYYYSENKKEKKEERENDYFDTKKQDNREDN